MQLSDGGVLFFRICKEFEAIRDRALKVPETTEDMMEMITYINQMKTKGIEELNNKIMVSISELFTFYIVNNGSYL